MSSWAAIHAAMGRHHGDGRPHRRLGAAVAVAALAVAAGGCSSARDALEARHERAVARATPAMWGADAVPEVLASSRRLFACLWERLDDPETGLTCRVRNLEAGADCLDGLAEGAPPDAALACWEPARLPCAPPAALVAQQRACGDEVDGRGPRVAPPR